MKVSDFKSGDIVFDDGHMSLVVEFKDELIVVRNYSWGPLESRINDGGIGCSFRPLNNAAVAEVFRSGKDAGYFRGNSNFTAIHTEQTTELSMNEIAEKFGVDVSTLKIKKD